ncbi:MAG: HlyD family secretion protein [Actinomycetota bacterium]
MRKRLLPLILAAVVLGGGYAAMRWATEWRHVEHTDDAYVDGDVTVIAPKVAGYVIEVAGGDNRMVEAGQVLVRIDPRDFQARVDEARAVVAARTAALGQIDDRVEVQKAVETQAQAAIAAAQADLKRAKLDFDRSAKLVRSDFVSRKLYDTADADAAKAAAGVRGSGAQRDAARHQLAALEAERAVAQAQLDQAKAQQVLAETDLEATVIRAPVAGMVGNRAVRLGQYVRPGQQLLAVVPLAGVWIDANYKETQLAAMRPGQKAEITVDAFPGVTVTGTVDSFSPASGARFSLLPPENATGNFTKVVQRVPVRITVPADNPLAGRLRPGLSVVVKVDTRG